MKANLSNVEAQCLQNIEWIKVIHSLDKQDKHLNNSILL